MEVRSFFKLQVLQQCLLMQTILLCIQSTLKPMPIHPHFIPWSSCEGIGLGGVRSPVGIVGVWSTVTHSAEDPTGE